MSVDSTSTTSSTDFTTNTDDTSEDSLSGVIVNEQQLTRKQRNVFLAAELAINGPNEVSFSAIARNAGVATTYVRYVMVQFVDRHTLPAACRVLNRCTPTKTYDDLTEMQRQIINEVVVNPEQTDQQIADLVGCSISHVQKTRIIYDDMVDERREKVCA